MQEAKSKPVAMISQPMTGISEERIIEVRDKAKIKLENLGYNVISAFFSENFDASQEEILKLSGIKNTSIYYLSKSIEHLSKCDLIYFCNGWEYSNGCNIEHEIADRYNIKMMFELN